MAQHTACVNKKGSTIPIYNNQDLDTQIGVLYNREFCIFHNAENTGEWPAFIHFRNSAGQLDEGCVAVNQVQYLKDISLYPYSVELYGRKTLYCRSNRPTKNPNNTAGPTILAGRKVEIAYSISDAGVVCGDSNPSFIKIYSYQDANYVWQLCNLFIDSGMVGYTGGGSGYQYIQTYGSW